MVDETYGTTVSGFPSDRINVRSGSTVAVSAAFSTVAGLVGGYNASEGAATGGEAVRVASSSEAVAQFGEDSELTRQVNLALENGAGSVQAAPVSETEVTGEAAGGVSGTLDNAPVFDPTLHPEHDITAVDTGGGTINVNIVYGTVTQPTEADTVNVNPNTGDFEFDSAATTAYEFDYSYGDYQSAITAVAERNPRTLGVVTENTVVAQEALDTLNARDVNFNFSHAFVGAPPDTNVDDYDDTFDDRRLAVIAASRGYLNTTAEEEVSTVGAVTGKQAGKPLGDSTTYENISGLSGLRTQYTNQEIGTLIDKQVLPLKEGDGIKIIKDMTTSTDPRFERIYASEVVDEATEISHQISEGFIGDANTESNRISLRESHTASYAELESDNLLNDYYVAVAEGDTEDEVDLDIGLDVTGVMDVIDVTITVGDVITNGGAS